jgi:hypothetical protein
MLSGIAIALGGRTASTGRGTGLKSFIKEGEAYVYVLWWYLWPLLTRVFLVLWK